MLRSGRVSAVMGAARGRRETRRAPRMNGLLLGANIVALASAVALLALQSRRGDDTDGWRVLVDGEDTLVYITSDRVGTIVQSGDVPSVLGGKDPSQHSWVGNNTTVATEESYPGHKRRSKVHVCYRQVHGEIGTRLLLTEFGYEGIDATDNEEWDLIYGGYPHCGESGNVVLGTNLPSKVRRQQPTSTWDWHMKSGLNRVLNERGWDNLKPHQVYFPCMGCSAAYCNKRELCRILRDINPDLCYVLPDDEERLKDAMASSGNQQWVLKYDASDIHVHTGKGVKYIQAARQLPTQSEQGKGLHLVQPWNEPFLGQGIWRRKSELRVFVAITSVYPLRAYAHMEPYVILAAKEYTNAEEALHDKCMTDTHSSTHQCDRQVPPGSEFAQLVKNNPLCHRCLAFQDYAEKAGMSDSQQTKLIGDTHELIAAVLKAGHQSLEDHPINRGIQTSGAGCFSHMRVDVGITTNGTPFIFEFPEFHNMKDGFGNANVDSVRELFHMIGLDETPVPFKKRAEFESSRLGGWALLPNLD